MRKFILPFILFPIMLLAAGCNEGGGSDEPLFDEYYVRYTATVAAPTDTIDVSYRMIDGHYTHVEKTFKDGKFEATIGPVIAGFEAKMVSSIRIDHDAPTLSIEVSKGTGPFVLKVTREKAITLSYTVGD